MTRLFTCVLALAVLAGCAMSAAPEKSDAAVTVGIGEQDAAMFTDPLFRDLGIKRSRIFVPWNAALIAKQRAYMDGWFAAAAAAGVTPLVSFSQSERSKCPRRPCKLPTVREYTRAFAAFRARYPQIKDISPQNEANHRSQPTFRNPKRAAQYFNIVRSRCRGCRIVAADVIDESNMESWLRVFKRHARGERIWGLHNYRDTNPRRGQKYGGTARLLRVTRGEVWLTETGGLVKFVLPNNRTLFPNSTRRANTATKRMFSLAHRYRRRIKRLYIYNWKQPAGSNRFDAGLIDNRGRARPAYHTVKRNLASSRFNP